MDITATERLMGVPKQLTPKQIKFAQELVYNEGRKTATQCAIEAKYSEDRAHNCIRVTESKNVSISCSIHWTATSRDTEKI